MSLPRKIFLAFLLASTVAYGMDSSSDGVGSEKDQYSVVLNYAWKKVKREPFPLVEKMFDYLQAQVYHFEGFGPSQADGTVDVPTASHIRSIKNEREAVFRVLEDKWREHPGYNEQSLCQDPRTRDKFRHMRGKGKASRNDGAPEDKHYQPLMMGYGFKELQDEPWNVVEKLYDDALGMEKIALVPILARKWNESPYRGAFRTIFDCHRFAGMKVFFDVQDDPGSQDRGNSKSLNINPEKVEWKKVGGLACVFAALVWYTWYSYKDLFDDDEDELIELDEIFPADKDDIVKQENNNALHQQSYPV